MISVNLASAAAAVLFMLALPGHANDPCACLYDTGLPEKFWKGGQYEDMPMISQYGGVCSPWDSIPGTPWYSGYCNVSAGKDYCTNADGWCDDSWCYVSKDCPTWTSTSVFKDVAGAPAELGYSYQRCGSKNCYTDPNVKGCPDDPLGNCPDPCACKYAHGGLPQEMWKGGQYENMPMISQYGAACAAWDMIPGTPWYTDYCGTDKDYCHRENSWCAAAWCYVDSSCPTWTSTSVFKDVEATVNLALGYSYERCGSTNCYTNQSAEGCPYDWDGTCCDCTYASGLPEKFWKGGKYANMPMISSYGVQCAGWDSIPGTPWYAGYCDTAAGKDYCASADSWCNDPWCYVDKDRCNSWVSTSVFKDVPEAPATLGYSYKHCNSLNCFSNTTAAGCPYDPYGECKGHSCGDVKMAYKQAGCCGNPTQRMEFTGY